MNIHILVAKKLIKSKSTLAVIESCTGGLITHQLTNVPGSSEFMKFGLVTYANQAKIKFLKIPDSLLKTHGAVSLPVAQAMAKGGLKILKTTYALAVTGIAGPGGASLQKPVGLVFIAAAKKNKILCRRYLFKGSRQAIKKQSAVHALDLLLKLTLT